MNHLLRRTLSVAAACAVATGSITLASSPALAYLEAGTSTTSDALLGEIAERPETSGGYDTQLFNHWIDADGDCYDTRNEVLIEETEGAVSSSACTVTTGQWYSRYDRQLWTDAGEIDIAHFVPLAEAYASGAAGWTPAQREAFANDLGFSPSLVAMTDALNRSRSDSDPAEWLPPISETHCDYVQNWVQVKYRWKLTVDQAEVDAIQSILKRNTCGQTSIIVPVQVDVTQNEVPPTPGPLYKNNYDGTIYKVVDGVPTPIGYTEWRDVYGFRTPQPTATDFVKYPWSPTIYAVTFWGQQEPSWQWARVSYDQWRTAGFPAARTSGWIVGSYYYKWGTANEIFVLGEDGVNHKLTGKEWADSGYRAYDDRSDEGLLKLSWAPEIAWMTDLASGTGRPMGYAEWTKEAQPSPRVVQRITGDEFYQDYGDSTIWYAGPGMNRPVSLTEWSRAGSPAPAMRGTPPGPPTTPQPPAPQPPPPGGVYYENCDAVRAAGKAPLYRGQPGYRPGLDGDGNGVACQ